MLRVDTFYFSQENYSEEGRHSSLSSTSYSYRGDDAQLLLLQPVQNQQLQPVQLQQQLQPILQQQHPLNLTHSPHSSPAMSPLTFRPSPPPQGYSHASPSPLQQEQHWQQQSYVYAQQQFPSTAAPAEEPLNLIKVTQASSPKQESRAEATASTFILTHLDERHAFLNQQHSQSNHQPMQYAEHHSQSNEQQIYYSEQHSQLQEQPIHYGEQHSRQQSPQIYEQPPRSPCSRLHELQAPSGPDTNAIAKGDENASGVEIVKKQSTFINVMVEHFLNAGGKQPMETKVCPLIEKAVRNLDAEQNLRKNRRLLSPKSPQTPPLLPLSNSPSPSSSPKLPTPPSQLKRQAQPLKTYSHQKSQSKPSQQLPAPGTKARGPRVSAKTSVSRSCESRLQSQESSCSEKGGTTAGSFLGANPSVTVTPINYSAATVSCININNSQLTITPATTTSATSVMLLSQLQQQSTAAVNNVTKTSTVSVVKPSSSSLSTDPVGAVNMNTVRASLTSSPIARNSSLTITCAGHNASRITNIITNNNDISGTCLSLPGGRNDVTVTLTTKSCIHNSSKRTVATPATSLSNMSADVVQITKVSQPATVTSSNKRNNNVLGSRNTGNKLKQLKQNHTPHDPTTGCSSSVAETVSKIPSQITAIPINFSTVSTPQVSASPVTACPSPLTSRTQPSTSCTPSLHTPNPDTPPPSQCRTPPVVGVSPTHGPTPEERRQLINRTILETIGLKTIDKAKEDRDFHEFCRSERAAELGVVVLGSPAATDRRSPAATERSPTASDRRSPATSTTGTTAATPIVCTAVATAGPGSPSAGTGNRSPSAAFGDAGAVRRVTNSPTLGSFTSFNNNNTKFGVTKKQQAMLQVISERNDLVNNNCIPTSSSANKSNANVMSDGGISDVINASIRTSISNTNLTTSIDSLSNKQRNIPRSNNSSMNNINSSTDSVNNYSSVSVKYSNDSSSMSTQGDVVVATSSVAMATPPRRTQGFKKRRAGSEGDHVTNKKVLY